MKGKYDSERDLGSCQQRLETRHESRDLRNKTENYNPEVDRD